ncbi:methyl-accepting chemotaxis protein [Clostridium aromativorans]|uniref:methyl-accepting chemotaxis protein n=1 Tax=Clostridium aromativorans TaxID=2836848 RepID=UPI001E2C8B15|nr:methyl-accepting chemotaxis protein [Clostridium aromativorans]
MLIYFFAGLVIGVLLCWLAFSYIRRKENGTIERALNGLLSDKYYLKMDMNHEKNKCMNMIDSIRKKSIKNDFKFEALFSKIYSVSDSLSLTIEDTSQSTGVLYNEAEKLSEINDVCCSRVNGMLDDMKKVMKLFENVKSTSNDISSTLDKSQQIITNGAEDIMKIVASVKEIKTSTDKTVERINELKDISLKISTILNTVRSISEQTTMLALNASIEAARAGEYGKGFSVVAKEISVLAENSKSSVSQIAGLIEKIENQIEIVIRTAVPNMENVKKSVAYSENIGNILNKMNGSVQNILTSVNKILDFTDKEYNSVENINSNFNEIQQNFNDINSSVNTMHSSVKNQNDSIQDLQKMKGFLLEALSSLDEFSKKIEDNVYKLNTDVVKSKCSDIIENIEKDLLSNRELLKLEQSLHKKILSEFLETHSNLEAIWTNYINGKFIYSNPPNGIANAGKRLWFRKAMEGSKYISDVYISAINSNPCVTVSMPIRDLKDSIVGVIGADFKIDI